MTDWTRYLGPAAVPSGTEEVIRTFTHSDPVVDREEANHEPDQARLNVVIEGGGKVWVRDVALVCAPRSE